MPQRNELEILALIIDVTKSNAQTQKKNHVVTVTVVVVPAGIKLNLKSQIMSKGA
jgi:hypothetical protein